MSYWDLIKPVLRDGPCTAPELASLCETDVKTMNARLQWYQRRGLVEHTGTLAPRRNPGPGRRAKFWRLV